MDFGELFLHFLGDEFYLLVFSRREPGTKYVDDSQCIKTPSHRV